jgi:hypothetical protein
VIGDNRDERERPENALRRAECYRARRGDLGALCRGVVAVEPSDERRARLIAKARGMTSIVDFPFRVVASDVEAREAASDMMRG